MKYREYAIHEAYILSRAMQDFLNALQELEGLFQLMSRNGFSKEQQGKIFEEALEVVVEKPGDDRKAAARRVKELIEGNLLRPLLRQGRSAMPTRVRIYR